MSDALSIIRYIFGKFLTLLFDNFTIFTNVSIGWVMVAIIIIAIMISNILSVAQKSQSAALNDYTTLKTKNGATQFRTNKLTGQVIYG